MKAIKKKEKKDREHALDQKSDQQKKRKKKENPLWTKKEIKKKQRKFSSFFLGRFLGRERVFFLFFLTVIVFP